MKAQTVSAARRKRYPECQFCYMRHSTDEYRCGCCKGTRVFKFEATSLDGLSRKRDVVMDCPICRLPVNGAVCHDCPYRIGTGNSTRCSIRQEIPENVDVLCHNTLTIASDGRCTLNQNTRKCAGEFVFNSKLKGIESTIPGTESVFETVEDLHAAYENIHSDSCTFCKV